MQAGQLKFGIRIRALRESLGLTQDELAERAGTSSQNIARIEQGERFVSAKSLDQLATALKVPHDELFKFGAPIPQHHQLQAIMQDCTPKQQQLILEIAVLIARS